MIDPQSKLRLALGAWSSSRLTGSASAWRRTGRGAPAGTLLSALGAGTLLLATALAAQVPTGGSYALPRQVIGAGGERASGGSYVLVGTLGQSATGPVSGSAYAVQQGFHAAAPAGPLPDLMFRNGFE